MAFFFLASLSGLFPGLTLPISFGWKAMHPFDLAFVACIAFAVAKGAFRPPDWGLINAGLAFVGAAALALWAHPSPEGVRAVTSLVYSVAVLLTVSQIRIDAVRMRVDRTILWPLFVAIGIAGVVLLIENVAGVRVGSNQSAALPANVHRFGGFTGANALILFLCLAAALVRRPRLTLIAILLPGFATLSRSLLGVGVALIVQRRSREATSDPTQLTVAGVSWFAVALGLFAYAFAVVPVASQRSDFRLSFAPGGYLTLHQAALRMAWSSPVVGVGPAQSVKEYRHVTSREERERVVGEEAMSWAPHSAMLGLAAEQGLLSLAAFAWLMYEIYKRLGRIPDPDVRAAALAGLTGLLVGGHFVDWLTLKGLWFWIGLLVAASGVTASLPLAQGSVGPKPAGEGRLRPLSQVA